MSSKEITAETLRDNLLAVTPTSQTDCPLFGVLPAEVRQHIFSYALADYKDPSPGKQYGYGTCYRRPSLSAPRRTDTALLQTCRAIYSECFLLPLGLSEQTHWFQTAKQDPLGYKGVGGLQCHLWRNTARLGEYRVGFARLRIFAEMFFIEMGRVRWFLSLTGLYPQVFTLTVRHTDWWHWKDDNTLWFEAAWLEHVVEQAGGKVSDRARRAAEVRDFDAEEMRLDAWGLDV